MVLLSSILNDQKKSNFISQTSLNLNYCDISEIDRLPNKFKSITKFFVSHNKLANLDGIEQFTNLNQISLGYNLIEDWREILKIPNKENVKYLSVQGNPLDNHPDHIKYILENFCNLEKLDDFKVDDFFRNSVEKHSKNICLNLIPFLFFLDNDHNTLEHMLKRKNINKELNKNMDDRKIVETIVNSSRIKWLKSFKKIRNFSEQTNLLSLLTNLSDLTTQMYDGCLDSLDIPNLRQSFYNLYKQFFYDLMIIYRKKNDKNLEYFLISQSILNDKIDHARFSEDLDYAKNCMMFELYKLKPTQAQIQGICCYDKENRQLNLSKEYFKVRNYSHLECDNLNNRIHNLEDQKINWRYKQNEVINDLEMSYSNPEILRNECLMHFPIFSCNKNYLKAITDIINDRCLKVIDLFNELNLEKKARQSKLDLTRPGIFDRKCNLEKNNLKRSLVKSETNEGYETKKRESSLDNYRTKKADKIMETEGKKKKLIELSSHVFQLSKTSQLAETLKKDEAILTESGYLRKENSNKAKIFKRNFFETLFKIIQKKYLMLQNDAFEEIKRESNENRKKVAIQKIFEIFINFTKKTKKLQIFFYKKGRILFRRQKEEEVYGKILKRRYFNLLCTNLLTKMKRYKSFKNKSLQYKAFFTLLKYAHAKNLKRKSIQTKFKKFMKNRKRIYFKALKEGVARYRIEEENERKRLSHISVPKEDQKLNFSLSEDLGAYINKIQENQSKKIPIRKCNCKSYFRKCHACVNIVFESI